MPRRRYDSRDRTGPPWARHAEGRYVTSAYRWNGHVAEAVGTFLFFFVGIGAGYVLFGESGAAVLVAIALAHGLALAVVVSAFGAVSGGHFNPAVTFGLWIAAKIDGTRAAGYVVAQLIGAIAAAALVGALFPSSIPSTAGVPALNESLGIDLVKGTIIEAVLTMLLLAAVFGTAVDLRSARIGGLAIGIAIAADIVMGGNLTGAAMNPARWFGPALIAGDFSNGLVWIVGPLAGAAIIGFIYRGLFLPEAEEAGARESMSPGGTEPIE
jgi:aquaporin TIP